MILFKVQVVENAVLCFSLHVPSSLQQHSCGLYIIRLTIFRQSPSWLQGNEQQKKRQVLWRFYFSLMQKSIGRLFSEEGVDWNVWHVWCICLLLCFFLVDMSHFLGFKIIYSMVYWRKWLKTKSVHYILFTQRKLHHLPSCYILYEPKYLTQRNLSNLNIFYI